MLQQRPAQKQLHIVRVRREHQDSGGRRHGPSWVTRPCARPIDSSTRSAARRSPPARARDAWIAAARTLYRRVAEEARNRIPKAGGRQPPRVCPLAGAAVVEACGDTVLVTIHRHCYNGDSAGQRFEHGVVAGMADGDRRAREDRHLGRIVHHEGPARELRVVSDAAFPAKRDDELGVETVARVGEQWEDALTVAPDRAERGVHDGAAVEALEGKADVRRTLFGESGRCSGTAAGSAREVELCCLLSELQNRRRRVEQ